MYEKNMITNEENKDKVSSILNPKNNMSMKLSASSNYSIQYQPFSMNFWGEGAFNDEFIVNFDVE